MFVGLVLVTDAMSALGLVEGEHTIGQMSVEIKNGVGYVAGTNTLCGSIATMIQCVQIFMKATGRTLLMVFRSNYVIFMTQ